MKKHVVTEILGEPEQDFIRVENDLSDKFWFVRVKIKSENIVYESSVTFDSLEDAQNLRVGDEFYR